MRAGKIFIEDIRELGLLEEVCHVRLFESLSLSLHVGPNPENHTVSIHVATLACSHSKKILGMDLLQQRVRRLRFC